MSNAFVSLEEKRRLAYYLWELRGRGHGYDKADWCVAEARAGNARSENPAERSPSFTFVRPEKITDRLSISHQGINEFFSPQNWWCEVTADLKTLFLYDRNRRLHFNEGFLSACYRIYSDETVNRISPGDHFPYKDLNKFRDKVATLKGLYAKALSLPPPLFYYHDWYQLEILDGVHRCLALYDLTVSGAVDNSHRAFYDARIWVGYNHSRMAAPAIARQLWFDSLTPIK